MALHNRMIDFERGFPYRLRCRAGLQAAPSLYNTNEEAIRNSPEIDRWNLKLTFQVSCLSSSALISATLPLTAYGRGLRQPAPAVLCQGAASAPRRPRPV